MKLILIAAILAMATPQQAPAPVAGETTSAGVIDGWVVRAGTSDPISSVQVTLIKPSPSGATLPPEAAAVLDSIQQLTTNLNGITQANIDSIITEQERSLNLAPGTLVATPQTSALTDANGHFSFKDLVPGKYSIRAVRDGYFAPPANGSSSTSATKTFTLDAQHMTMTAEVPMVQGGVISGSVRDPKGQAAFGVNVATYRIAYVNGRLVWGQTSSTTTDDRGDYRIFWLSPGEYYVGIIPRAPGTVPGPQDSWLRTFFPGVSEPASASLIKVKDRAEVKGIDFTIQAVTGTSTFKVSGKAVNPLPNVKPNTTTGVIDRTVSTFVLTPLDPGVLDGATPPQSQNSLSAAARPNNEFEIRNVRPGSYDLYTLWLDSAARRYYTSRTPIEIRNSDIGNLNLAISPGVPLSGEVVWSGTSTTPIKLESLKVNLRVLDTTPPPFATIIGAIQIDGAGKFSAIDVPEARYTFAITGLPESAFIADIRHGDTSVYDTGVLLGGQSAGTVQIIVNPAGQNVEGTVLNAQRKPAAKATVVLVPPATRRENLLLYKNVSSDDAGHFALKGVPPGEYTMFAWENVPNGAWMNAPFLTANMDMGRTINVSVDTRSDVQLDLIPDSITPK